MLRAQLINSKPKNNLVNLVAYLLLIMGLTGLTFSGETESRTVQENASSCGEVALQIEDVESATKKRNPEKYFFISNVAGNLKNCQRETSAVPAEDRVLSKEAQPQNPKPPLDSLGQEMEKGTLSEPTNIGALEQEKNVSALIPEIQQSPHPKYTPSNPMPRELARVLENPFAYPSETKGKKARLPEMTPNESLVFENGNIVKTSNVLQKSGEGYVVVGDSWSLNLQAVDGSGSAIKLNLNGQIVLNNNRYMEVNGIGFAPGSLVKLWLFSDPGLLGRITVDSTGGFSSRGVIPEGVLNGDHTVQINGVSENGQIRSVSYGVVVETSPFGSTISPDASAWWLLILAIGVGYFLFFQSRHKNDEDVDTENVDIVDLFPDALWK